MKAVNTVTYTHTDTLTVCTVADILYSILYVPESDIVKSLSTYWCLLNASIINQSSVECTSRCRCLTQMVQWAVMHTFKHRLFALLYVDLLHIRSSLRPHFTENQRPHTVNSPELSATSHSMC